MTEIRREEYRQVLGLRSILMELYQSHRKSNNSLKNNEVVVFYCASYSNEEIGENSRHIFCWQLAMFSQL
jgi:hypothetical protein